MSKVKFAGFTPEEMGHVDKITTRAIPLFAKVGVHVDRLDVVMDLAATHKTCPLDLAAMADGREEDFAHDIGGIRRHLNRITGELEDCFVPRFARRTAVPV